MENKLYVARDLDGILNLYNELPRLNDYGDEYIPDAMSSSYCEIDKDLFPDLKFEDGPVEVTLNLVK